MQQAATGGVTGWGLPYARVHFIGIGGVGMSAIARVLLARGIAVSGSDAKASATLEALRGLGAAVHVGQAGDRLPDADVVVASAAIDEHNGELAEARRRGLPVIARAAALAALMQGSRGVAVAGTHGKTTTTSMVTVALQACGLDPSYAIGGDLLNRDGTGTNGHSGSVDIFVAEADESDGSFVLLSPEIAVVTNVEADHLDHYADLAEVEQAFQDFASRLPLHGLLVCCADDPGARRLAAMARAAGTRVVGYGTSPDAELRIEALALPPGGGARFQLVAGGEPLGEVLLALPGIHNARNASAALAVGLALGADFAGMSAGLAAFRGAGRRMQTVGTADGVTVIDSYDHHPTELAAVLAAARQLAPEARIVAVFQPHRFTRTQHLGRELGAALGAADEVVVMEVYAAGESPIEGVSGAAVAAAVPLPSERVHFVREWDRVAKVAAALAKPGDLVLTLGAGDVTRLGPLIVKALDGLDRPTG